MSTFAKKVTSAVAGLAIVFSVVSPIAGVSAAYTAVDAANKLATLGVIVDQSANPADYRLGDNLPRKEAVKVMMNLSSIAVVDNCNGDFSDLSSADWACKYAETALANGMVAANATFGPDRLLSNIEGLKMVFQGRDLERNDNADWRAGYVDAAVEMGIANNFTDYDTAVTRGQFFIWAANAIDAETTTEDPADLLCELLGDCPTDPVDPVDPVDPTDPVVVDGDALEVTLSPATPEGTTIPGAVNGLAVAAFDFTAGVSDVTVSQVSVKRTGLSDSATLESLAIFTSEGRASNAKSDNQDNDTTAQINLDNGGIVIEAGETETLVVVVDVASEATAEGDQFALEVVDVVATSPVTLGDVKAETMEVGSVDAPTLVFDQSSSVSNPTLGEEGADLFEFEIDNSSDEDVVLRSVTFEGSSDAEDDLMNFELLMDNDVVATTTSMNGDYLTFDLGSNGLTIEEDKTEDFTVRADVVAGAGDTIEFRIDEELDVTADSTKFGYGAAVTITNVDAFGDLGSLTIEAGELTFVEVDAENDEIREDKDNVELGSIKITNIAGQSLEMESFGVNIALDNGGTATLNGNTPGDLTVSQLFTDVELYNEDTGSSYELTETVVDGTAGGADQDTNSDFEDTNIDVLLPEGTTTWVIRADTAEDIDDFDAATIDLSVDVSNDITVVETSDDEEVTDKTPSSLSFNSIDGSESGADVTLYPLADTDVVRGSDDVVMLQFEVEAEQVSDITVDELTVYIDANGSAATNQEVADIKLYQGSVSESNLLDEESGSDLGAGSVTFDRMPDVNIAANATETFIVTVSFVDGDDAVSNSDYFARLTAISIEDDENDDVTVTSLPLQSARDVTVNQAGTLVTPDLDDANEDNEFDKVALAGNSAVIASFDVRADNEEVDVETATFTVAGFGGTNLGDTVVNASLLLDGVVVATNANSDISNTSIVFEDMVDLIIPETTTELALQLNTANIGEDETGEALTGLQITQLVLSDAEGVESGKDTTNGDSGVVASKLLDVVTAVITPTDADTFGSDDKIAELRLVVDGGSNTDASGDAVQAELIGLDIEVTSLSGTGMITVLNGNGDTVGTGAVTADGTVTVAISSDSIGNDDETYEIQTTAEAIYKVAKDGVNYSVNGAGSFTTKLENTLNLGEYSESN